MIIGGIDEAGRGALIGPLVVAGVFLEEVMIEMLSPLGVKDSKKLSLKERERIFEVFKKRNIPFHFIEISPAQIDKAIINGLEIKATASLIVKAQPHRVFLDVPTFGRGVERYCTKIKEKLGCKTVDIIGGNKFDERYPIVAAASIVAKVMRDRKIEALKRKYGDFASGYPNKKTIRYLETHYKTIKQIVRKKWKTVARYRFASS